MNLELPSRLLACMQRIRRINGHRLVEERVWLYAQTHPDYFNAILTDNIAIVRARYGFSPDEHGDWVYPAIAYIGSGEGMKPMNSWILKFPASSVPSIQEIKEQREWCADCMKGSSDKTLYVPTEEELHEFYVKESCTEFRNHIKLLSLWREVHGPRDQQDCWVKMDRVQLKAIITSQRKNTLQAKSKAQNYKVVGAPAFIVERALSKHCMEAAILNQLQETMRYC